MVTPHLPLEHKPKCSCERRVSLIATAQMFQTRWTKFLLFNFAHPLLHSPAASTVHDEQLALLHQGQEGPGAAGQAVGNADAERAVLRVKQVGVSR